jgi:hypothetical protein
VKRGKEEMNSINEFDQFKPYCEKVIITKTADVSDEDQAQIAEAVKADNLTSRGAHAAVKERKAGTPMAEALEHQKKDQAGVSKSEESKRKPLVRKGSEYYPSAMVEDITQRYGRMSLNDLFNVLTYAADTAWAIAKFKDLDSLMSKIDHFFFPFLPKDESKVALENKVWQAKKMPFDLIASLLNEKERRWLFDLLLSFLGFDAEKISIKNVPYEAKKEIAKIMDFKKPSQVYPYIEACGKRRKKLVPPADRAVNILKFLTSKNLDSSIAPEIATDLKAIIEVARKNSQLMSEFFEDQKQFR